ncbi:MAG: toprim domain-containing protein [Chthoniobacteraceae bacterium]|jgi:hypothetical protein
MSATPLERALDWWGRHDDMGGFKTAAEMLFPGWIPGRSCHAPYREDKEPSFSIYRNESGVWRFKDFAGEQGGLVGFVMLAGMDEKGAARWLIDKAGNVRGQSIAFTPRPRPQPEPWQPYAMDSGELGRCVSMAEALLREQRAIDGIAKARKWRPETIRELALDPCIGLHEGRLVLIYPTGAKVRLKPLMPSGAESFEGTPFYWLFGKPDALWRGDRLLQCTETVHITEGETAAISLIDAGIDTGTTEIVMAVPGASCWRDEWAKMFRGRGVVIWPDADDAGDRLKQRIIQSVSGYAKSIEVVATAANL